MLFEVKKQVRGLRGTATLYLFLLSRHVPSICLSALVFINLGFCRDKMGHKRVDAVAVGNF